MLSESGKATLRLEFFFLPGTCAFLTTVCPMRATIATVLDAILGELDTSVKLGKMSSRGRRRICHPILKPKRYPLSQTISLGKAFP